MSGGLPSSPYVRSPVQRRAAVACLGIQMLELAARGEGSALEAVCAHPEWLDEGVYSAQVKRAFRQGMDQQVLRVHIGPAHHYVRLGRQHRIDLGFVLWRNDTRDHRLDLVHLTMAGGGEGDDAYH